MISFLAILTTFFVAVASTPYSIGECPINVTSTYVEYQYNFCKYISTITFCAHFGYIVSENKFISCPDSAIGSDLSDLSWQFLFPSNGGIVVSNVTYDFGKACIFYDSQLIITGSLFYNSLGYLTLYYVNSNDSNIEYGKLIIPF